MDANRLLRNVGNHIPEERTVSLFEFSYKQLKTSLKESDLHVTPTKPDLNNY
jgi:hypothetical protein